MAPVNHSRTTILWVLTGICITIEALLIASDLAGLRVRILAYEYAGFWPGILDDWAPNYPLQPQAMFLSYGFLHSGAIHLIVNMITLWSLGRAVIERVGSWSFLLLYLVSILGGAACYGLVSSGLRPMVGASGALFGLAGGLLAWMYVDRFSNHQGLLPVAQAVVLLIIMNVVLWWAMNGLLAWETHLGGFLAGWVIALIIDPRPNTPKTQDIS